jgi:hypothetical protein
VIDPVRANFTQRADQACFPVTSRAVLTRSARPLRVGGLLAGSAAAVLLVVAGCTSVTGGNATVNAGDAPAYRTSMSVSVSVSAASSSARESERQASLTTQAMHDTCETLSTTSADAIDAVNAYVSAFNQGGANVAATEQPAVDALNKSADAVASSVTAAIPQDLKDAFDAWVNGARTTAKAIADRVSPSEFNAAVDSVNETRSVALKLCDATY